MKLQPIVYTTSMEASIDWYGAVLDVDPQYRSDVWTSFAVEGGYLALHRAAEMPHGSQVELSLVATERLETLVARLEAAAIAVRRGIQDETFGRSLLLEDPSGLVIQVNEHDGG